MYLYFSSSKFLVLYEFIFNPLLINNFLLFKLKVSSLSADNSVSCNKEYLDSVINFIRSSEIGIFIFVLLLILLGIGAQQVKKGSISVFSISIKWLNVEFFKNVKSSFILYKYFGSYEYSGLSLLVSNFPEFE